MTYPLRRVVGYERIDRPRMAPSKIEVLECGHHGRLISTTIKTRGNRAHGKELSAGRRPCALCG